MCLRHRHRLCHCLRHQLADPHQVHQELCRYHRHQKFGHRQRRQTDSRLHFHQSNCHRQRFRIGEHVAIIQNRQSSRRRWHRLLAQCLTPPDRSKNLLHRRQSLGRNPHRHRSVCLRCQHKSNRRRRRQKAGRRRRYLESRHCRRRQQCCHRQHRHIDSLSPTHQSGYRRRCFHAESQSS